MQVYAHRFFSLVFLLILLFLYTSHGVRSQPFFPFIQIVAVFTVYIFFAYSFIESKERVLAFLSAATVGFSYLYWYHAVTSGMHVLIFFFLTGMLFFTFTFYRKNHISDNQHWIITLLLFTAAGLLSYLSVASDVLPFHLAQFLPEFVAVFITQYSLLTALLCVLGMGYVFVKYPRFFGIVVGSFVVSVLCLLVFAPEVTNAAFFAEYSSVPYFLLLFFFPFGLATVQKLTVFLPQRAAYKSLVLVPFFIIPLSMLYFNLEKTDIRKSTLWQHYYAAVLSQPPKDSVLYVPAEVYAEMIFLQQASAMRNDIVLRRLRTQTFVTTPKGTTFSLLPFRVYDTAYVWMPTGSGFLLTKQDAVPNKANYLAQVSGNIGQMHIPRSDRLALYDQNARSLALVRSYAAHMVAVGDFLRTRYNDSRSAFGYYNTATIIDDSYAVPYVAMAVVQAQNGQCAQAKRMVSEAVKRDQSFNSFKERIANICP